MSLATARKLKDRIARWFVSAGGLAVIACILGILVFLVHEVWPLWAAAYRLGEPVETAHAACSIRVDPYLEQAALLGADGVCRVVALTDGHELAAERIVPEGQPIDALGTPQEPEGFAASTVDGRVHALRVTFEQRHEGGSRKITAKLVPEPAVDVDPARRPLRAFSMRFTERGSALAAQLESGSIEIVIRESTYNEFKEEREERVHRGRVATTATCKSLLLDRAAKNLYAVTSDGSLAWWPLSDAQAGAPQWIPPSGHPRTAIGLLLAERALIAGSADGSLAQWQFVKKGETGSEHLTCVRTFPPLGTAVRAIEPATRNRGFLALGDGGVLAAYYGTTGSRRWSGCVVPSAARAITFAAKNDAAYAAGDGAVQRLDIDDPHPEADLGAMLGKVWYEDAPEPTFTYQSTGGPEFEPKLGLVPLLFGTLKGTIFSLILAVPLAVLGAMYVSHFMHPRLRGIVKPVIELMAALPSVVLGFVAAMWLAPRVESWFCALLLAPLILPAAVLTSGWLGSLLPRRTLGRFPPGAEVFAFMAVLVLATAACLAAAPGFERVLFGGDVRSWLMQNCGYQQQNAIVVGLAMSFAVTPIVFSISEEAFTNVPRSIVSASLALGASRWQTVTQVVLPSASPGIFSAIMVGFGRAVGETMIVLMASGGGAILDWSAFNGFRTLSLNLAEQAPEAPHGGTLYRVLFLTGLVLFGFTFVVNTIAEVVRQRLRSRFA